MTPSKENVNWHTYAQKYDMLLEFNPFYQALRKEVLKKSANWKLVKGDTLIDLGGGTGNYSIEIAKQHPLANIIHIDNDKGMIERVRDKILNQKVSNITIIKQSASSVKFSKGSIKGLICIHALYTFPEPTSILEKIYNWSSKNGKVILVDPGRTINVLGWQLAIGFHLIKNHGLPKALSIMKAGNEVSKQNKYLAKMQKEGKLWLHSHDEFCGHIEDTGFVIEKSFKTFRGISDFVVAKKPH